MVRQGLRFCYLVGMLAVVACAPAPKSEDLRLTPLSLAKRQMQTRVFEATNEQLVLASCSAVLQDLGFLLDESEHQLGLLVGSKMRSAVNPAEVAISIIIAALAKSSPIYSERQLMRVSLVTSPLAAGRSGISVRATFQRTVYSNEGLIFKLETIGNEEIYDEFFAKLSKALFLEAEAL